jgi:polyvinyl alcohol dehydrogenase (cytochrome)
MTPATAPGTPAAMAPVPGVPSPAAPDGTGTPAPTAPGVVPTDPAAMPGAPAIPEGPPPTVEWTAFNYDNNNSRNNRAETKITVQNVATLTQKWQQEVPSGSTSTPQVVGGKVYVSSHDGSMYRLDAETGMREWTASRLFSPRTGSNLVVGNLVLGAGGQFLRARNIEDGSQVWNAQLNTHPNTMIDSSPVLVGDLIVIGVANYEVINSSANYTGRGAVVAVDMMGTEKWRWWATPDDATAGAGVSVWSSAAYDPGRKMIFIGTGQPYELPAGEHSNALVALDAVTGEPKWFNQFHPDDAYTQPGSCKGELGPGPNCDLDIGASPNLFRAQGMDAVGVGSKGGLFRTFERETGTMLWEVQLGAGTWWGGVMAVAATDDTTIYVANNNYQTGENIFALDMNTGDIKWMTKIEVSVWGALSLANGVLFSTGKDGMMRAYDSATGVELKSWDIGHDAAGGVSISDGVVYAPSGFTGQGSVTRSGGRVTAFALP